MRTKIHFQAEKYAVNIYKDLIHDDIYEDDHLKVFVRGNGYWTEPVKWLNAQVISLLVSQNLFNLDQIDGTFFIIIQDKKNGKIQLITDHLNFFPLYIKKKDSRIEICDSLMRFKESAIDQLALKQLFSLNSIIGDRTIYEGISKLSQAHTITIDRNGSLSEESYWQCSPIPTDEIEFKKILNTTIARIPLLAKQPSLTFTAGLDSRMIFSELIKQDIHFSTFTFGHNRAVDVITAKKIAKDFNVPHKAYQTDTFNEDFVLNLEKNIESCLDYADGMIPFIRGVAANYCFKSEADKADLIVTATGELVYSHYAEVPTLFPKDNSSIESIAEFLIEFNADKNRPSKYSDLSDVKDSLIDYFKKYSLPNNILYYDAFYLSKLSGLTSYYQQFLSSDIRVYNPIFTKKMINHSLGLNQSLRDHRKLQRDIIVENEPKLNRYLVNGFKVVKPTFKTTILSKFNYGLRLIKKLINKLFGKQIFSISYVDYLPLLRAAGVLSSMPAPKQLNNLPPPTQSSSEGYLLNYLSLSKWLDKIN